MAEDVLDGTTLLSSDDLALIRRVLARILAARTPASAARVEDEEVIADALERFSAAVLRREVDMSRSPAAYLVALARYRQIDGLRRMARRHGQPGDRSEASLSDERALQRLDSVATRQVLLAALRAALDEGHPLTVRVVVVWLDLAQGGDSTPGSREVGRAAGVSHQTVLTELKRFRAYLTEMGAQT